MKNFTIISFSVLSLLIAPAVFAQTTYLKSDTEVGVSTGAREEVVACTMDAKACPDGSYVGRTGPNCEFAPCPSDAKVAPPPPPSPLPPGDPDFDLLRVAPPSSASGEPTNSPNDVNHKTAPSPQSPVYHEGGTKGENPLYEGKSKDDDDDADGILTADEEVKESISVSKVTVRGWDPEKKQEFMAEHKTHAEVKSGQDLEHFATDILLEDDAIEGVEFNPREVQVSYHAKGKLFWLFPVTYTERVIASAGEASSSDVEFTVKKPWYAFLIHGTVSREETAGKVKEKHKQDIGIESWSWGVSNQARLFDTIVDALKA